MESESKNRGAAALSGGNPRYAAAPWDVLLRFPFPSFPLNQHSSIMSLHKRHHSKDEAGANLPESLSYALLRS